MRAPESVCLVCGQPLGGREGEGEPEPVARLGGIVVHRRCARYRRRRVRGSSVTARGPHPSTTQTRRTR